MDRDTEVTLTEVYDGIVGAIAAKFPDLHVEAEREDRSRPPIPACLIELAELEPAPDNDPGTDQLAVVAVFEAQLIMGFKQPGKNAKREVRELAASLAAFARLQRWDLPIGPAEGIGAYPDDFAPELDQFECWRVEWRQIVHLGNSAWNNDGSPPTTVMVAEPGADEYAQLAP